MLIYKFFSDSKKKTQDIPIYIRLMAGVTTGSISVLVAQPTDVVKIRMQGQGTTGSRIYRNSMEAYRSIAINEGIRGLWKGNNAIFVYFDSIISYRTKYIS